MGSWLGQTGPRAGHVPGHACPAPARREPSSPLSVPEILAQGAGTPVFRSAPRWPGDCWTFGYNATGGTALNANKNHVAARFVRRAAYARLGIAAITAATTIAMGCEMGHTARPEAGTPPRVYVGDVNGTDVRVAVVATSNRARIYFCGGPSSYATATKWLVGDIDDTQHVTAAAGDGAAWSLDARVERGTIGGVVRFGDTAPHAFRASAVAQGTIAGLYETTASCGGGMGKVGLIVAQSSWLSEPVGQGACIEGDSANVMQVNPIMPLAPDADGALAVTTAGTDPALVRPATPPAE